MRVIKKSEVREIIIGHYGAGQLPLVVANRYPSLFTIISNIVAPIALYTDNNYSSLEWTLPM